MGTIPALRLVSAQLEELYDYDVLRTLERPTMFIVRPAEPTLVLGGSQSMTSLDLTSQPTWGLRRRRGGGGAVLLRPDDVWVDWWLPSTDPRWSFDIHVNSRLIGHWWLSALAEQLGTAPVMHEGSVEGDPAYAAACFAGAGPGEIFVDGRKLVGVTQWRVREGVFVSTVAHHNDSQPLAAVVSDAPTGLAEALAHQSLDSLGLDGDALVLALRALSTPVDVRQLYLLA